MPRPILLLLVYLVAAVCVHIPFRSPWPPKTARVVLAAPPPVESELVLDDLPPEPAASAAAASAAASSALLDPAASASPLLDRAVLWAELEPHCGHLPPEDVDSLRGTLDVLLAKVGPALRAEIVLLDGDHDVVVPPAPRGAYEPADVALPVLAAVRTAQDLLRARCFDAPTVGAAMLAGCALTAHAPTWPGAVPDAYTAAVSALLDEARALKAGAALAWRGGGGEAAEAAVAVAAGGDDADDAVATATELDASRAGLVRAALLQSVREPRALLVLLADHTQRLRAAERLGAGARRTLAMESLQLFAPLAYQLGVGGAFSDLEALSYVQLFPKSLHRLHAWMAEVWPDAHGTLRQLTAQLASQLECAPALVGLTAEIEVSGRVKTVESTFRKLLRRQLQRAAGVADAAARAEAWQAWQRAEMEEVEEVKLLPAADGGSEDGGGLGATEGGEVFGLEYGSEIEKMLDVVALRVVLTPAADAAAQLGALMQKEVGEAEAEALLCHCARREVLRIHTEVPGRFKDFVSRPKPNGYQSIHTNLRLPDGRVVEVQIRTAAMHAFAESGGAAHQMYRGEQLASTAEVPMLMPAASEGS